MNGCPKISLITVNFNGLDLTCALLESIRRNVTTPLEIIVVDNGSDNDEAARIEAAYPEARVIRSGRNLGFAGGNNLGAAAAEGEFLFFINNDTEILEDGLQAMLDTFEKNEKAGIVCPKIRFFYGSRPIQFAGYTPMKGIAMKNDLIGFRQEDDGRWDTPAESPFAHGAAMMVRREAMQDAGPMPECYFLYFEELDWSLRFTEKGWKILYQPAFTVFHKESATTGEDSPLKAYYMVRSRQLFAWRNFKGLHRILTIFYARWFSAGKRLVKALLSGNIRIAKAVLKANFDFHKMKKEKICQ